MRRGLSVWLFSKVVMVIFLLTVFTTVVGFMKMLNDRVSSDAAESVALQAQQAASSVLTSDAREIQVVMSLPPSLPEPGWGALQVEGGEATRGYAMKVFAPTSDSLSFAVALGNYDNERGVTYNAASAMTLPAGFSASSEGFFFTPREGFNQLAFSKGDNGAEFCVRACHFENNNLKCDANKQLCFRQ